MSALLQNLLLLFIYIYYTGTFYEVKGLKLLYIIINKSHCPYNIKNENNKKQTKNVFEFNKPLTLPTSAENLVYTLKILHKSLLKYYLLMCGSANKEDFRFGYIRSLYLK